MRSLALAVSPRTFLAAAPLALLLAAPAALAQRVGYVDSQVILPQLPEFQSARQEVDRLAAGWQAELNAMDREVEALEQEFQARELLYTADERTQKAEEIQTRREEMALFRRRHFGPEGELFREEQQRMRPVQERVLVAVEAVAEEAGYDFVFDRGGDVVFLYARPALNLTDLVLLELGIDPERRAGSAPGTSAPDPGGDGR